MLLRKDDPWEESLDIPDIRNWRVVDADGRQVGFVESLFVERTETRLEAIYTGANERFPISDIEVADGVVHVRHAVEGVKTASEVEAPTGTFEKSFRAHFEDTYAGAGHSFDDLVYAYRFGRTLAADGDFAGRSFDAAEEDVRAYYAARPRPLPFDQVRGAVRFGFQLVHDIGRYQHSGMEREGKQILAPSGQSPETSSQAGTYMSTGRPPNEDGVAS